MLKISKDKRWYRRAWTIWWFIAGGVAPYLTVDKCTDMDGEYEYRFCVHYYDKHHRPYRPINVINKEKINMIVKLD